MGQMGVRNKGRLRAVQRYLLLLPLPRAGWERSGTRGEGQGQGQTAAPRQAQRSYPSLFHPARQDFMKSFQKLLFKSPGYGWGC